MLESTSSSKQIFHFLFCLLLIGLPFSKALVSIAFVGLILFSIFRFIQLLKFSKPDPRLLFFLPAFLFLTLSYSLFYSENLNEGVDTLISQMELFALPFILFINQQSISTRFDKYIRISINAITTAALFTIFFFLIPVESTKVITTTFTFLQDYIIHEKKYAFGVYSPFIDRLQFSYMIGVAIFLQIWLIFRKEKSLEFIPILRFLILVVVLSILGARGAQISFLVASTVWVVGIYFKFFHTSLKDKFGFYFSYSFLVGSLIIILIGLPIFMYKTIPAVQMRYNQLKWEINTFKDGTFRNYDYVHFTSIRRLVSWKNSWNLIKENPILGVGIGDYQNEMEKQYAKDKLNFPVNTQSQFLYYWSTAGIFSLISLILLLCFPIWYALKYQKLSEKFLVVSFLIFYSCLFLFDAPLNFQVGGMTFLTYYGLIITYIITQKKAKKLYAISTQ